MDRLKKIEERFKSFHHQFIALRNLSTLMKLSDRGNPIPMPHFLFVEPTNACNYKCPKCPQAEGLARPTAMMDIEVFKKLIAEIAPNKTSITLHHTGEPLMHPKLFEMIKISRGAGLYTIVVTNGSLLARDDFRMASEGPDALTFSIDGGDQDAYASLHGDEPLDKVLKNIGEFFKRRHPDSPTKFVQASMVRKGQTPQEMERFYEMLKPFPLSGIMVRDFFVWPTGVNKFELPEIPKGQMRYPCGHPWMSPAVLADGSVTSCCLDAGGLYRTGNLKNQTFMEIFNGPEFNRLRKFLLHPEDGDSIPLCESCQIRMRGVPMSMKRHLVFQTMPIWRKFFKNLPSPIEAIRR